MSIATVLGALMFLGAAQPGQTARVHQITLHPGIASSEATGGRQIQLSPSESRALIARLVDTAQSCIVQTVGADPAFRDALRGGHVGNLIVAAFEPCWSSVDALITAHDRQFGAGSGETFVTGPFLDTIPRAIERRLREPPHVSAP